MPRTALTVEKLSVSGLNPTFGAANVDGHSVNNANSDVVLYVKNGDASPHTVTIVTPRTVDGMAVSDSAVAIPAGEERAIGPFPSSTFGASLTVDFDAVTSVTIAAFK